MKSLGRLAIMAEMHGRDLTRRHVAVTLLVLLPVSFFLSAHGDRQGGVASGGISLAFSIGGVTLFSVLSSARVDQRLVLAGYRPAELIVGRLLFLLPFGGVLAAAFALLEILVAHPANRTLTVLGVLLVAAQSVPFGLLVGYLVPNELEGTLVLIGVVGVQLASTGESVVARALPLYGARRLLLAGYHGHGAMLWPALAALGYGVLMLGAATLLAVPKLGVVRTATKPQAERW